MTLNILRKQLKPSDGKEMENSLMAKSVAWSQSSRACFSFTEDKTEDRKTHIYTYIHRFDRSYIKTLLEDQDPDMLIEKLITSRSSKGIISVIIFTISMMVIDTD